MGKIVAWAPAGYTGWLTGISSDCGAQTTILSILYISDLKHRVIEDTEKEIAMPYRLNFVGRFLVCSSVTSVPLCFLLPRLSLVGCSSLFIF